MIEILNRCNYLIGVLKDCDDIQNKVNCPTCMSNSFYGKNNDTYNCLKKLCYYTINYGPIYVSEIYHFLVQSNFLKSFIGEKRNYIKNNQLYKFNNSTQNNMIPIYLNIMSLGCGFGPDDIALDIYRNNHLDFNIVFNYYGYDKEPLWNFVTQTNALPITYDLSNGMNFQNIDIIFINKLFSTLKKHNLHTQFLTAFQQALQTLPSSSFVVFNDINHQDMGRDEFDKFAQKNSLQVISKYYFPVDNAYTRGYTKIDSTDNIYEIPIGLIHQPKKTVNKTIFFLYQKV